MVLNVVVVPRFKHYRHIPTKFQPCDVQTAIVSFRFVDVCCCFSDLGRVGVVWHFVREALEFVSN